MIIFDIFSLAVLTDILSLITGGFFFFQLTILIISVCVLILFILNLVYPNFEKVIEEAVSREKQRKSYLSNVDRDKLKKRLDDLLRKREVFRDEHLSLKKLASMTEVSTHQLSEFINTQYGMNYSVFINEFRVKKAQELLHDKPEYTILAIAYEVGFNSKSAFNDAFHKITGKTPSQFRDHQL
jgi:AraC-like DNA-binding protein